MHYRSRWINSGWVKSKKLMRIHMRYTLYIFHTFSKDKLKRQICFHTYLTCIIFQIIDRTMLGWKLKKKKTRKIPTNLMERIMRRDNWCWQDGRIPLKWPQIQFKLNWLIGFSCHSEFPSCVIGRLTHSMPWRWFFRKLDHDQSTRHCHKSLSKCHLSY